MLTIRREQLSALGAQAVESFVQRMVGYLADEYPGVAERMGPAGLSDLVRKALQTAAEQRVRHEGAVAVWIELQLQFGPDFERSPDRAWARNIMAHRSLPDYIRVGLVRDRLTARTAGRPVVRAVAAP